MKKVTKTSPQRQATAREVKDNPPEYPAYPASEDIYTKYRKEENVDPEDITKVKKTGKIDNPRENIEGESEVDIYGSNLDVPGSELDDEQENVGNEDEENNYYSIGGDDHNNLDEDKDDL